ncbi:SMC5-SMC6 complex localization factor protein 2 isoform X3 [Boleophthalmus pectinirostris]|uniref:SMC5-SMC6 complex localization factor protein 2 isoform X3 n=1 Tax=Boleophthalmus pectinirostris TaxID=150288 RepID=UPI002430FE31|nr:SMC5-SMC6 complex localization factor protein 2 isoform X3 [Boleophthalmus pectinirostris]
MTKSSKNHRDYGILSEHFSPGSKVRDLYIPQHSPAFTQETPMKPSQIPNRFPHQPHRPTYGNSLHYGGPEQHHRQRQRFGTNPCHPPRPPGPHHYHPSQHQHSYVYNPPSRRDGENYNNQPQQHCPRAQAPHGPVPQWRPVTLHPPPQSIPVNHVNYTNGHAMFPYRDPPKSTEVVQDKPRDKVEPSPVEMVPMVELRRPSDLPLPGGWKESAPQPQRESWSTSSSSGRARFSMSGQERRSCFPSLHSLMPTQERYQEETASHTLQTSRNCLPTRDTQQKRPRESGTDGDNAKKPCLLSVQHNQTLPFSAHVPISHSKLPDSELSPETPETHIQTESLHAKPLKPAAHSPPHTDKSCIPQACIQFTNNNVIVLTPASRKSGILTQVHEEFKKKDGPASALSNKHNASCSSTPNEPKSLHKVIQVGDNKIADLNCNKAAAKASTGSPICRKFSRPKKQQPVLDDLNDLFTPDPIYTVSSGQKIKSNLKARPDDKAKIVNVKNEQSVSSHAQTPVSKLHKEKTSTHSSSSFKVSNSSLIIPDGVQILLPTVSLTRVIVPVKTEKDTNTSGTVKQTEERQKKVTHDDSVDLDLDLSLDLHLDDQSSQSSDSEEEPLVSLQEIMKKRKPPDTPEKGAFSEPSTSGHTNHKRLHHTLSTTKTGNYKNSLDQMLKEITTRTKAKGTEMELLTACQEDLMRIAEFEEADEEEPLSLEHQQIVQRYSLFSSAIREVPPGHELFHLEKFGRIFNQNTLELRQCKLNPQETAEKTLLWSSPSQFKLYIHIGLFQEAFQRLPCPFQITRFLFKMMCVHSDHMLSVDILQVLTDIAYSATTKIVNGSDRFRVWVPSVADITLVLMNMGVSFVSLFPLETLQPPFTEGRLLEDIYIKSESPSTTPPSTFPEHNCNNMFKYLSCCLGLCPRFYSDSELFLLLTSMCTVSLETRLLLQAGVELYPLLYKLLNNIRHWEDMMPKICLALTDLTDDHHNMCHLVQLLPDHTRGKTLRRHLSLSMISKLLDGSCLYRPKSKEMQLSDLRLYVQRMKPSSLLRTIISSSDRKYTEEDQDFLDQQAYYLCYSLLTLTNEATNMQYFPPQQKEHLLLLCSELERHVKCHIRESEKWLYRSKVKDLVARIYTKWQMLLQKTRPLNGKLYDYWQPLQLDSGGSQDIEEIESSQEVTEKDCVSDEVTVETGKQDEGLDCQDGEANQIVPKDSEEGNVTEEVKAHSTFELDTEGGDDHTQEEDDLCEDMDTETEHTSGLSPEQSLSPAFEFGHVKRPDTALPTLLQTS